MRLPFRAPQPAQHPFPPAPPGAGGADQPIPPPGGAAGWPAEPGFGAQAAAVTPPPTSLTPRGNGGPPPPPGAGGPSAAPGPAGAPASGPFGPLAQPGLPGPFEHLRPPPTLGNVGNAGFLPPPAPPRLPPPPLIAPPPTGPGRLAKTVIAVAAAVALLAVATFVLIGRRPSGPAHPDAWDARVAELVAFVETERGLTFKHPVTIDFVAEADLATQAAGDHGELSPEDRAYWDTQARVMRALGLARGPVDLADEQGSLVSKGVVAFYSPAEERIVAPAGILSPRQRSTLVHELTHALQDQHFDIGRDLDDAGARAAYRALIEGDAERVQDAYVAQLSAADRADMRAEVSADHDAYEQDTATITGALDALFQAPYVLGTSMTETMIDLDGLKGVNAAFRSPPVSEEAFLDPIHYRGNGKVLGIDAPRTVAGENVVDEGTVGALGWYLLLSEATDMGTALNAAFGWGGDAYVAVDSGRDLCVRIAYRGDTAADNEEMASALGRWVAAAPEARREVAVRGADVHVTACDPGPDSPTPLAGTATEALLGPRVVTDVARELRESGATFVEGRCVGMGFVSGLTPAQLEALWYAPEDDQAAIAEVASRVAAAAAACRANA